MTKKGNRESIVVDKDWEIGCEFGNGLVGMSFVEFASVDMRSVSHPNTQISAPSMLSSLIPSRFESLC